MFTIESLEILTLTYKNLEKPKTDSLCTLKADGELGSLSKLQLVTFVNAKIDNYLKFEINKYNILSTLCKCT